MMQNVNFMYHLQVSNHTSPYVSKRHSLHSQKQGFILATNSVVFNVSLSSLSFSNLQSGIDRSSRLELLQVPNLRIRLLLKASLQGGIGYIPAGVDFLCCVVVIADVSAQAVGGIERALTLATGVSLHGLAGKQKQLSTAGTWKALTGF